MGKFKAPADVKALDTEELAAAVEEALAEFGQYAEIPDAEVTDEQFAEMQELGGFAKTARAELSERQVAADARAAELAAMRQEMSTGDEGADEDEAAKAEAEAAEAAADEAIKAEAAVKIEASAKRTGYASKTAAKSPAPKPTAPKGGTLVAAAEVPGFAAGQKFDSFSDASSAILNRLQSMPTNIPNHQSRAGILNINVAPTELSQSNQEFQNRDLELLLAAGKESSLKGGSLVAAGGWGAPSERTLDFCELENVDSLIQLPEVTITRGGVQYTKGPTLADVLGSSTGFWDMDEATAEAGVVQKTFLRPTVPGFTEKRLSAVGIGLEAGLLLRQGWPEVIDRHAKLLTVAHQIKMARKSIALIQGFTGAATPITNAFGNAFDIFHILELLAVGERQRLSMSVNQTLEALIPNWVKAVVRADLAQRQGVDTPKVTDAEIDSYLTARGIKAQWITQYQDMPLDPTSGLALTYPDTVEVIFYPAGSFVRGVAPVIQLDTIYDSTNLKKNDYLHLFMEQGVLMTNPCGDGHRVSFPLYANGRRAGVTDSSAGQNDTLFNAPVA
jgi:hypothetical protein